MIQSRCITSIFYETLDFPHSFRAVYRTSVCVCVCERNSAVSQHENGIQAQREAKVELNKLMFERTDVTSSVCPGFLMCNSS